MINQDIIIYNNQVDYYSTILNSTLYKIRIINEINNEFLSGNWDSNIKYKSSLDKKLMELQPKHFQERDKWVDFIFITKNIKTEVITFTIEGLVFGKIRLILLLFWKDIASKLSNTTNFKLQLKLNFYYPLSDSKTETAYSKDLTYHTVVKSTPLIRSIGSVNIYNKNSFYEALSYLEYHLTEHADQYYVFHVTNIILTFNICQEDSILNKIDTTKRNFNLLVKNHSKDNLTKNKFKLKVFEKKLPLTADLTKWGNIQIIKGEYPYPFDTNETNIIINTSSGLFNYMVSIRGIIIKNKNLVLHRVSVTDKKFKSIFFNFIDIVYDLATPDCFARIYQDTQEVYNSGIRVLVQKRKKVRYFTNLPKCKSLSEYFITMDLETKNIEDVLVPYCVSIYDGKKAYSFYITDFNSSDDMLKASIKFILKRKYNKHRVYLHNFSYFDGIFLMRAISSIVSSNYIKPIIRDGRIINLKVEFYSNNKNKNKKIKYYLEFRDSYLLLTSSLEKLGNTFAINRGNFYYLSFSY